MDGSQALAASWNCDPRLLAGSNGGNGCRRQRHLDGGAHTAGLLTEMLHSRAVRLQPAAAPEHAVQPLADARHHDFADGFNTYTITSLYGNDRRRHNNVR